MSTIVPLSTGPLRPEAPARVSWLRIGLLCYAALLGLAGSWLLVSNLLRPGRITAGPDQVSAAAATGVPVAYLAAQIGMVRADLWADAAFLDAATAAWPESSAPTARATAERLNRARNAMETALALAPVDAEGWLFLAKVPSSSGRPDPRITSLLEMAYFTAPNSVALAPRRLERAAASIALSDPEIRDFVRTDIRRLLAAGPAQKAAIVTAYRNAAPENRELFEALVAEVAPSFAATLPSAVPH